jgi:hypothetical protein
MLNAEIMSDGKWHWWVEQLLPEADRIVCEPQEYEGKDKLRVPLNGRVLSWWIGAENKQECDVLHEAEQWLRRHAQRILSGETSGSDSSSDVSLAVTLMFPADAVALDGKPGSVKGISA